MVTIVYKLSQVHTHTHTHEQTYKHMYMANQCNAPDEGRANAQA